MRRLSGVVAMAAVAALGVSWLSACATGDSLGAGEARLTPDGVVDVSVDDGPWMRVDSPRILHTGDRVRSRAGTAAVELADGSAFELAPATTMALADPVIVVAGRVLALAADRHAVGVDAGIATLSVSRGGVARVERDLGATFGAYRGTAVLTSAGRRLDIPSLHEAAIAGRGLVPGASAPLRVDPTDAWDRRYLGLAIDLGRQLEAQSAGVSAQFPEADATLLGRLVPEVSALSGGAGERPAGERLVGALVALHGSGNPLPARWEETFAFRSAGASWGLVALDQGATDAARLADAFAAAIANAPLSFAGPRPGASDGQAPGPGPAAPPEAAPPAPAPPPPPGSPPAPTAPPPSPLPPAPPITGPPLPVPTVPDLPLLDQPPIDDPGVVQTLLDALL